MSNQTSDKTFVVFGDSWTDNGIGIDLLRELSGINILPPEIYSEKRVTDKFNYADYMREFLGVSEENFLNYSVGGGEGIPDRTANEAFSALLADPDNPPESGEYRVDLVAQVDRFIADLDGSEDNGDVIASLLIGGNDFMGGVARYSDTPGVDLEARSIQHGQDLYDSIFAQAEKLADAGVGEVYLYTQPDMTIFPISATFTDAQKEAIPIAVDAFNDLMRSNVEAFEALGIEVKLIDKGTMIEEIAADPNTFGFRNFDLVISNDNLTVNPEAEGVPWDQIALVDIVHKSDAMDQVLARFQFESLTANVEIGSTLHDHIHGTHSEDLVLARDGDDFVWLGRGDDIALGGLGDDVIKGGRGEDLIAGGSGDDYIAGGRGDDFLADNNGDDIVKAGRGDDIIVDGAGSDVAFGGRGDDVFVFSDQALLGGDSSDDMNVFIGGRGHDTLYLRLTEEDASAFNAGDLSLADLGISTFGIEEVVARSGLETPDELAQLGMVQEAEYWGLI